MATVPGDPNDTGPDPYGGIPPGLRPGYPELLMAAAIHKQQQDQQQQKLAGDVIPLPFPRGPMPAGTIPYSTHGYENADPDAIARGVMGGKVKVLPMTPATPGKQSQADNGTKVAMSFEPLADPKDDDEERQRQQQQKQKKKKSEADGEFQVAQAGEPMIPEPIQNVLDAHARGNATASDVRKVLQPTGWSVDLRRGRYEYELFDPTGKQHFHAP